MRCDRLKCLDSLGEPQGSPFFLGMLLAIAIQMSAIE